MYGPKGERRGDIIGFVSYCGPRWEEIAALTAVDVHIKARHAYVHDPATESGGVQENLKGDTAMIDRHAATAYSTP